MKLKLQMLKDTQGKKTQALSNEIPTISKSMSMDILVVGI